jgi:hypothetical protein
METAEVFVMERMDAGEASVYRKHLGRCQACSELVEMTRAFVQGMRDASRHFTD